MRARQPSFPGAPQAPLTVSCSMEPQLAWPQCGQGLPSWGRVGSHHGASPVALDREVWAEEQVCDGQEQGLSQGPGILVLLLTLLRKQDASAVAGQAGVVPELEDAEDKTGSRQLPRASRRQRKWTSVGPKSTKAGGRTGKGQDLQGHSPLTRDAGSDPHLRSLSPVGSFQASPLSLAWRYPREEGQDSWLP